MKTCKDCGEKFEKLTKTGICKKCYARKSTCKHKGISYVAIKDLPIEEKEKILNLRKVHTEKATKGKIQENKINEEDITQTNLVNKIAKGDMKLYQEILKLLNIDEQEVRNRVLQDIEKEKIRRKITLNYDNYLPLMEVIEVLNSLAHAENYLTDYIPAYKMFNDLVNDYQHQTENASIENLKDFIEKGIMENEGLQQRRPIKDVVEQYENVQELFEYIKQDPKLVKLIEDTRIALKQTVQNQNNPMYASKASDSILNQENVFEQKRMVQQRYDVWVPCYGLYGNKNREIFRLHGGTMAESPEKAKENLRKTIAKLSNVTYKDFDIQVKLWEEIEPKALVKEGA